MMSDDELRIPREMLRKLHNWMIDLNGRALQGDARARELFEMLASDAKSWRKGFSKASEYYRDLAIAEQYGVDLKALERLYREEG